MKIKIILLILLMSSCLNMHKKNNHYRTIKSNDKIVKTIGDNASSICKFYDEKHKLFYVIHQLQDTTIYIPVTVCTNDESLKYSSGEWIYKEYFSYMYGINNYKFDQPLKNLSDSLPKLSFFNWVDSFTNSNHKITLFDYEKENFYYYINHY